MHVFEPVFVFVLPTMLCCYVELLCSWSASGGTSDAGYICEYMLTSLVQNSGVRCALCIRYPFHWQHRIQVWLIVRVWEM